MEMFYVPINGNDLERAIRTLRATDAPDTPLPARFVESPDDPGRVTVLRVVVEAEDERSAQNFVREVLGADYEVGAARAKGPF